MNVTLWFHCSIRTNAHVNTYRAAYCLRRRHRAIIVKSNETVSQRRHTAGILQIVPFYPRIDSWNVTFRWIFVRVISFLSILFGICIYCLSIFLFTTKSIGNFGNVVFFYVLCISWLTKTQHNINWDSNYKQSANDDDDDDDYDDKHLHSKTPITITATNKNSTDKNVE